MNEASTCPTRLISDLPAEEDAFGPHDRLATAIADLIRSEDGGRTIALEGGWGSGKSTVVNLLEQKLDPHPDVTVSVFDAWAHEGDPLRRTFLERLIIHLSESGWVEKKKWHARREELARRRKIAQTRDIPQLTTLGKVLTALLFFVPVGAGFFAAGVDDSPALVAVGAPLMLAPLLVLALVYVWQAARTRLRPGRSQAVDADAALWAVFANTSITQTVTETIENPDPTSVEFDHTFTELMDDALSDGEKRIVLVLDNLDRVDPKNALSIWSTLQTFLHYQEHGKPTWFNRLWVLIPHDPSGIRRLWNKAQESDDVARAFLDKSFQVRFEVPPPVLSDWHAYLLALLKQALPNHHDPEFHVIYRLFALQRTREGSSPTPRDLKLYVNDIGALHRQRQDEFPLSHLAYYAVLRRSPTEVAQGLLDGKVPTPELAPLLGQGARDNLAALAFNVNVQLGRQLLLRDPIQNALTQGDSDRLQSLAQSNPEAFWEVLEMVATSAAVSSAQPAELANAARGLAESGLLGDQPRPEARAIERALRDAAVNVQSWSPFDHPTAKGIASLCQLLKPDEQFVSALFAGISASPIGTAEEVGPAQVSPVTWADAFLIVITQLESLGLLDPDSHKVSVPADPAAWIDLCRRINEQDPDGRSWRFLRPQPTATDIARALASLVAAGNFSEEHLSTIRLTLATQADGSWTDLVTAISQRLQAPNTLASEEIVALFESLWQLRAIDDSVDSALNALATQGHVLHHLHQVASGDNNEAPAWCIFTFLRAVPAATATPEVGNSQAGYNSLNNLLSTPGPPEAIPSAFVHLLARAQEIGLLFTVLDAGSQAKPFIVACLKLVAQRSELPQLLTPEVFADRWSFVASAFDGPDFDKLVERLLKETALATYLRQQDFDSDQAILYAALVKAGATSDRSFRSWCVEGLRSIDKAEWVSQLGEEGQLAELLMNLVKRRVKVDLAVDYQDALAEHGNLVISGDSTPSALKPSWSLLLKPLSPSARGVLRRKLYDGASRADGEIDESFFDLYGEEIADQDLLQQNSQAAYRLFTPLLNRRNVRGLRWLAALLEANPAVLDQLQPDTVEDFKARIAADIAEDKGDDAAQWIHKLAAILAIEPYKQKPPPE